MQVNNKLHTRPVVDIWPVVALTHKYAIYRLSVSFDVYSFSTTIMIMYLLWSWSQLRACMYSCHGTSLTTKNTPPSYTTSHWVATFSGVKELASKIDTKTCPLASETGAINDLRLLRPIIRADWTDVQKWSLSVYRALKWILQPQSESSSCFDKWTKLSIWPN